MLAKQFLYSQNERRAWSSIGRVEIITERRSRSFVSSESLTPSDSLKI